MLICSAGTKLISISSLEVEDTNKIDVPYASSSYPDWSSTYFDIVAFMISEVKKVSKSIVNISRGLTSNVSKSLIDSNSIDAKNLVNSALLI